MIKDTKKKILIVITKSNFGGAQKYVYDLSISLRNQGFDVYVALGESGLLKDKLETENVKLITIPNLQRNVSLFKEFFVFFNLIKIFNRIKPDVLHLNSSKIGGLGSLAGRLVGIKNIIFSVHGWAFNENRNFLSKNFIKFLYWVTIILSHKTIAVSNKTKEDAPRYPFANNKIIVIHNGIKEPEFLERSEARIFIKNKLPNIDESKKWVITLAELHKIKGLDYLVESAKKLENENINFVIFGEGEERDELEKHIKTNRLEEKVFLAGFVENGSKYLKGFDLFLMTSISEALPLSILEAGYAQIPVIATRVGGIPEIIKNEFSGILVPPKNTSEISDKISEILRNPEKALYIATNLHREIENNFSFNSMLNKTIEVYNFRD